MSRGGEHPEVYEQPPPGTGPRHASTWHPSAAAACTLDLLDLLDFPRPGTPRAITLS
ncbi:hypothetical protein [Streptomyces sp. NPDC051776]|uniref:hypothetical protein n=1 Tax=Streptomyces sp. NPDC051776 TaxID=3155414 RepID=UPI0034471B95